MRINAAIIGAGNVAWHLAPALDNAGIVINKVYNRSKKHAAALVKRLYQAELQDDLYFPDADIIFLCVADDALEEIIPELQINENAIVIHTAGSIPLSVLSENFRRSGVFYPLQTFSKTRQVDFKDVPILIEASDQNTASILLQIAKKLSNNVNAVSSEKRILVHLAAVFACNFSNHMITAAEKILKENNLKLDILLPLITETINKSIKLGPQQAQTGPARRKDLLTMDKHLELLKGDENLFEIYQIISQDILDMYG